MSFLRVFRNRKRKQYIDTFNRFVKAYLENSKLKDLFKQTPCKRAWVCYEYSIIIRPDYLTADFLGVKNYDYKKLQDMMKYYEKKKYNIIVVDLFEKMNIPDIELEDITVVLLTELENEL